MVGDVSEAPFLRLRVDRVGEPVAHFRFVTALSEMGIKNEGNASNSLLKYLFFVTIQSSEVQALKFDPKKTKFMYTQKVYNNASNRQQTST